MDTSLHTLQDLFDTLLVLIAEDEVLARKKKELQKTILSLKQDIITVFEETGEEAAHYKHCLFSIKHKQSRVRMCNKDKHAELSNILQKYGPAIQPSNIVEDLKKASKTKINTILVVTKLKAV